MVGKNTFHIYEVERIKEDREGKGLPEIYSFNSKYTEEHYFYLGV